MFERVKIGTRASPLAVQQAEDVAQRLRACCPQLETELVKFTSTGDRILGKALADVGGKGLFAKEIEEALLGGQIDCAVHSSKDLETHLPQGLALAAFLPREPVEDVLICRKASSLQNLPQSARVGTASARRKAQLLALRPDLKISLIRGNVGTRLAKVDQGLYDATLLAAAGLNRLSLLQSLTGEGVAHVVPTDLMPPAVAQGIVAVQVRDESSEQAEALEALLAELNDPAAEAAARLERHMLTMLDGSCKSAISVFCQTAEQTRSVGVVSKKPDQYKLQVKVYQEEGAQIWQARCRGELDWSSDLKSALASVEGEGRALAKAARSALG